MTADNIVIRILGIFLIIIGLLYTRYGRLKEIKLPFLKPLDDVKKANEDLWNKTLFGRILPYNRIMAFGGVTVMLIGLGLVIFGDIK